MKQTHPDSPVRQAAVVGLERDLLRTQRKDLLTLLQDIEKREDKEPHDGLVGEVAASARPRKVDHLPSISTDTEAQHQHASYRIFSHTVENDKDFRILCCYNLRSSQTNTTLSRSSQGPWYYPSYAPGGGSLSVYDHWNTALSRTCNNKSEAQVSGTRKDNTINDNIHHDDTHDE
jgi:hypothetical protein